MSRRRRLAMVDRGHPGLSVVKLCRLLRLSRSSVYYRPAPAKPADLELYERERLHQSLGYRTPAQVFASGRPLRCLPPDQVSALLSRETVSDFTAGASLNLAPLLS